MAVRIVTDSTSDIPASIAAALGITVVPVYVRFGEEYLRDRVGISEDELYRRLVEGPIHPATSTPSPGDFGAAFERLAAETDAIVCITLSSKESGTYGAALIARETAPAGCRIELIDSQSVTMGLGLIAMAAARAAQAGRDIDEVATVARDTIAKVHLLGILDTLKYVQRGGRVSRLQAVFGTVLDIKVFLTMRDGELIPAGRVRTRSRAIERLDEFVREAASIAELAVMYSTDLDEARALAERVERLAHVPPIIARLGPALGVHAGPGFLGIGYRER